MQKVTFSKVYTFEGKEYKELNLNLENLTGKDMIDAAVESKTLEVTPSPVPELSKAYLAVIAAKSSKVPVEFILNLPAKEFSKVTLIVQNFLMD